MATMRAVKKVQWLFMALMICFFLALAIYAGIELVENRLAQNLQLDLNRAKLSHPISKDDYLKIWLEESVSQITIRPGDPILGYPVALENYVHCFFIGDSGGETIRSWIDSEARAAYLIPVIDAGDKLVDSFVAYRVSDSVFEATRGDELWTISAKDFFIAQDYLARYLDSEVLDSMLVSKYGAHFAVVKTEGELFGKLFELNPGGLLLEEDEPPGLLDHLDRFTGEIMTEEEIVQLFRELSGK